MTVKEYEAFCLRCLDTCDWQKENPDLASSYRERYVAGGWNEEDLRTLTTLHMLWEFGESLGNVKPIPKPMAGLVGDDREDLLIAQAYVWLDLLVRDELREEVIRQCVVEHRLRVLEAIEISHGDWFRSIHESSLSQARADSLAASLGVLPGTPEYDQWIQQHQKTNFEGGEAK